MTPEEYKLALIKAKHDDVEYRWTPRLTNPEARVSSCRIYAFHVDCSTCPMATKMSPYRYNCDIDQRWCADPTPENAQAIIDHINSIDVDKWTKRLIRKGILKREE